MISSIFRKIGEALTPSKQFRTGGIIKGMLDDIEVREQAPTSKIIVTDPPKAEKKTLEELQHDAAQEHILNGVKAGHNHRCSLEEIQPYDNTALLALIKEIGTHTQLNLEFPLYPHGMVKEHHQMVLFKVRDYSTLIMGRYDPDKSQYYSYRGDGAIMHVYEDYRVTQVEHLSTIL